MIIVSSSEVLRAFAFPRPFSVGTKMDTKANEKMKVEISTKEHRLWNLFRKPHKDVPNSAKISSLSKFCRMLWKRIFKRSFAWQMVKNVIFFACCSFFIIQSIEFYNQYSTYPTTTSIAVESPESLKIPAITVCDKNIVLRTHFCDAYPDSCQIPNDIEKFCQRHPVICEKNHSNIMLPKFGYYTNTSIATVNSLGGKAWKLLLTNPKTLLVIYYPFERYNKITYVRGGYDLPYVACFSSNLHIFSQQEREVRKFYGGKANTIRHISIHSDKYEAFYPWMVSPVFFSIHSSVIPENPLTAGKAVRPGYQYKVSYRLEEEHLLPHPYATNCTDYDALWRRNNKTGPRSQEMCIYMCLKKYNKRCTGCEGERMMHQEPHELCRNPAKRCVDDDYYERLHNCKRNCNADCVKQKYHYTVEEIPLGPFHLSYDIPFDGEKINIAVHLIDKDVTVISHIPRYGEWELFSYIGGLIGCWLGISVWAFVDIIEANFRRFLRLIRKLRQKSKKQTASCV
ncbi:uncharacterized protein CDAR_503451 [Caerostris darwini]|uniref:Uncharacterized protein n=1 Tax=Caerostris darwini TaxID=1538125 RepID=A0AAV4R1N2_9ARAC|nr:uncharacterized protein CDAR_503451 [Caerostris darwini]